MHEIALTALQSTFPTLERKGFKKAARKILVEEGWEVEDAKEELQQFHKIPDGWFLDKERRWVICVEVEVTNFLKEIDLVQYTNLWWAFDDVEWELRLFTADRFGNVTNRIDLLEWEECRAAEQRRKEGKEMGDPKLQAALLRLHYGSDRIDGDLENRVGISQSEASRIIVKAVTNQLGLK